MVCVAICALAQSACGQARVVIVDGSQNRLVMFEWPSGKVISHFVAKEISGLSGPQKALFATNGKLYVSSSIDGGIRIYDSQTGQPLGDLLVQTPGLDLPSDMIVGPDGRLYVCFTNSNVVKSFDLQSGQIFDFIATGNGLVEPHGIVFDSSGNCFVASMGSDQVLKYSPSGQFIEIAVPQGAFGIDQPRGLVIDKNRLLVVSSISNSVLAKDLGSGVISELVPPGTGGLSNPYYASIAPGDILFVTSIQGDGQLLKFDINTGEFKGELASPYSGGLSSDPISSAFVPDSLFCYADCDGSGRIDIDDFICFQTFFAIGC